MIIYKFYNLSLDYNKEAIHDGYFYFSKPSEVNDIYDCKPIFVYDHDTQRDNFAGLRENVDYKIKNGKIFLLNSKKHSDVLRVLSLSKINDSILMWSLYSSNSGICIGYDLSRITHESIDRYCIGITNTNISYQGSLIGNNDQIPLNKIKYCGSKNLIPYKDSNSNANMINRTFLRKKTMRGYEKEWRAIITESEIQSQKIYYEKSKIKEVIFGLNTSSDNIEFVKKLYGNNANYYYAKRNIKKNRMDIVEEKK